MFLSVVKVLGVVLIVFLFSANSISADDPTRGERVKAGSSSQKVRSQKARLKGTIGGQEQTPKKLSSQQESQGGISGEKAQGSPSTQPGDSSIEVGRKRSDAILDKKALPGTMNELLLASMPFPPVSPQETGDKLNLDSRTASRTVQPDSRSIDDSVIGAQSREDSSVSSFKFLPYLEIEVSHSGHTFNLYSRSAPGKRETLYECKVGLGGPGFPTPVGIYFVTHIYDDDPWWIPPKDRAWAAGDKPSRRVYGGTMAPLLKKRDVRSKKESTDPEDKVSGQVKLEDYGYRFHGTNSPRSIGHNQSHGCVRMLPADAKKVANLIKEHVGTADRKESENGSFVILKSPVRLNLVK